MKQNDMFSPKEANTEKLADGWARTFRNEAPAGASFFVQVRREIGGMAFLCETVTGEKEKQAEALMICTGMRR